MIVSTGESAGSVVICLIDLLRRRRLTATSLFALYPTHCTQEKLEETTLELKEVSEDPSREEDAGVAVGKNQALLQEEEDRPHYNPNQGEHSHALYTLYHT